MPSSSTSRKRKPTSSMLTPRKAVTKRCRADSPGDGASPLGDLVTPWPDSPDSNDWNTFKDLARDLLEPTTHAAAEETLLTSAQDPVVNIKENYPRVRDEPSTFVDPMPRTLLAADDSFSFSGDTGTVPQVSKESLSNGIVSQTIVKPITHTSGGVNFINPLPHNMVTRAYESQRKHSHLTDSSDLFSIPRGPYGAQFHSTHYTIPPYYPPQSNSGSTRSSGGVAGSVTIRLGPGHTLKDAAELLSNITVEGNVHIDGQPSDSIPGPLQISQDEVTRSATNEPLDAANDPSSTRERETPVEPADMGKSQNAAAVTALLEEIVRRREVDRAAAARNPARTANWIHATDAIPEADSHSVQKDQMADLESGTERPSDLQSVYDAGYGYQTVGVTVSGAKIGQVQTVAFLDSGALGQQANLVSKRFLIHDLSGPPLLSETGRTVQGLGSASLDTCGDIELKIWPKVRNHGTGCMEAEAPIIQRFMVIDDTEGRDPTFFGDILLGKGYMERRGRSINGFSFVVRSRRTPGKLVASSSIGRCRMSISIEVNYLTNGMFQHNNKRSPQPLLRAGSCRSSSIFRGSRHSRPSPSIAPSRPRHRHRVNRVRSRRALPQRTRQCRPKARRQQLQQHWSNKRKAQSPMLPPSTTAQPVPQLLQHKL
jgi:hypothetical protein